MTRRLTEPERSKIFHALGGLTPGSRNRFTATIDSPDDMIWRGLFRDGLAEMMHADGMNTYHVTEAGITALNAMTPRLRMQYAGAEWVQANAIIKGKPLSPLGRTVADALGFVWRGIYHLPSGPLSRVDWGDPYVIAVVVPTTGMATWDFDRLTRLVVVCHDLMLRMELDGVNGAYVRLVFHQRWSREGGMSTRMPTLEDHVNLIRVSDGYDVVPEGDLENEEAHP